MVPNLFRLKASLQNFSKCSGAPFWKTKICYRLYNSILNMIIIVLIIIFTSLLLLPLPQPGGTMVCIAYTARLEISCSRSVCPCCRPSWSDPALCLPETEGQMALCYIPLSSEDTLELTWETAATKRHTCLQYLPRQFCLVAPVAWRKVPLSKARTALHALVFRRHIWAKLERGAAETVRLSA